MELTKTRLRAGVWQGVLSGAATPPQITVTHLETPISGVTITPLADQTFQIAIPIPARLLNDGVQTFVIQDNSGDTLGSFAILAGSAMDDDLRAEIDLLRAELDLLKRAFRRHCVETA